VTRAGARRFVEACRKHGIGVIPQFQSPGHQSWAKDTWPLLTKYPEAPQRVKPWHSAQPTRLSFTCLSCSL
jgi:hypothetical protein